MECRRDLPHLAELETQLQRGSQGFLGLRVVEGGVKPLVPPFIERDVCLYFITGLKSGRESGL